MRISERPPKGVVRGAGGQVDVLGLAGMLGRMRATTPRSVEPLELPPLPNNIPVIEEFAVAPGVI